MKGTRQMLAEHCGGHPNVVQQMLIERAAVLALRLALADIRVIEDRLVEFDNKQLIAWQNALTRTLVALGVHHPEAAPALAAGGGLDEVMQEVDGAAA